MTKKKTTAVKRKPCITYKQVALKKDRAWLLGTIRALEERISLDAQTILNKQAIIDDLRGTILTLTKHVEARDYSTYSHEDVQMAVQDALATAEKKNPWWKIW